MIKNKYGFCPFGSVKTSGYVKNTIDFTMKKQLLDPTLWAKFVKVFRSDSDNENNGWRCEFWGKMMRGACLVYMQTKDEQLYRILTDSVLDMLSAQRPDGRFSTYNADAQLRGWDVWGRKYVLTAMLHYVKICREEELKRIIIRAMCAHADALIAMVGDGKTNILETSNFWGGANSASILDAILELYTVTNDEKYLKFGEYILSTGGCIDGSLIEAAMENIKSPYEYPENKAYETMSFFEGVLTYYQVTEKEEYLHAVENFIRAVDKTDITVIGCSGCTHELFDHSAIMQTEYKENIMQETCVSVTWMRLLTKFYMLTGDLFTMDRIERTAWNAMYGSLNEHMLEQADLFNKCMQPPLPFDSYAPLYNNKRGRGVGGLMPFSFGGHYGCCACIAAAGIAIYPLTALVREDKNFFINHPIPMDVSINEKPFAFNFKVESEFPAVPKVRITFGKVSQHVVILRFRIPESFENVKVTLCGEEYPMIVKNGYLEFVRIFTEGDVISIEGEYSLKTLKLNEKTAFTYGPLVLARDAVKEGENADMASEIPLLTVDGAPKYRPAPTEENELIRLYVKCSDGNELLLTDFASCGKKWNNKNANMTVWMNVK